MNKGPKLLDPFKDNLYRREVDAATGERVVEKSCPKCSKKAGTVIYYPESDFTGGTAASERSCVRHRKA